MRFRLGVRGNNVVTGVKIASLSLSALMCVAVGNDVNAARDKSQKTAIEGRSATVKTTATATATLPPSENTNGQRVVLGKGDTIYDTLVRQGVSPDDVAAVTRAMGDHFDARRVQPGDAVVVVREPVVKKDGAKNGANKRISALHLEVPDRRDVAVVRGSNGRFSKSTEVGKGNQNLHRRTLSVNGDVHRGLGGSGLPAGVVRDLKIAAGVDASFPTKAAKGAAMTVVYETNAKDGGTLRFASLQNGGREHRLYRFALASSEVAYVDESGRGMALVSLDTPIETGEISSGWGWRVHPVLKVKRFHRGVDYRAPRGTPALAAADGVVEEIGRRGNYGLYLRIRHGSTLSTAYAHMDRFAADLRKGSEVRKGQPVGYVGTTGLATGPHLYYEVLVDDRQVNPLDNDSVAVPVQLSDHDLARFKRYVEATHNEVMAD